MVDYGTFDPVSGARTSASFGGWTPPTAPAADPHTAPTIDVTGDPAKSYVDGPVADNIVDAGGPEFDGGVVDAATGDAADPDSAPDANDPGDYADELAGQWNPSDSEQDPHDDEFEVGDEPPSHGPTPKNIVDGVLRNYTPGPFSRSKLGL